MLLRIFVAQGATKLQRVKAGVRNKDEKRGQLTKEKWIDSNFFGPQTLTTRNFADF